MKIIYTREGVEVLVDDEDYERLNRYSWRLDKHGYAYRTTTIRRKQARILMHREVMGLPYKDPRQVDHRFGIRTDNRKSELRICDGQQNQWNRRLQSNNTSGLKNVVWVKCRAKWVARIGYEGGRKFLGYFDTPEEAYEAYKKAAFELHGEFARVA